MRGTSAHSLGEIIRDAQQQLGSVDGSLEGTAADLFDASAVIDSSNQLVRLLSDPGRSAGTKEAAARDLFGGRVGDLSLTVIIDVVRHRWSEQEDILEALELTGVITLLEQALREDVLATVEEELFQVSRLIDQSPELTAALDEVREDAAARADLIGRILAGRVQRITILLAQEAVRRTGEQKPAKRVLQYAEFASDRRKRRLAIVTSARPLGEPQVTRLGRILERIYGHEIQINVEVSPALVGGLRVQIGDDLFDATVLARLAQARERLAA